MSPAPLAPCPDGLDSPRAAARVLIVEDEPLMSALLAQLLTDSGFRTQTAADTLTARAAIRSFDPHALLLDISLGDGPTGIDLAHIVTVQRPDIAVLVLTKHPDARAVTSVEVPSACGFLRKDQVCDTDYLLECLGTALDRRRPPRHDLEGTNPLAGLDAKHLHVLRLMATGYTNERIASLMDAGLSSVERWVSEVFRHMSIDPHGPVNPRVEAVRRFVLTAGVPDRL